MFSQIWNACKSLFNRVKDTIKQWTKPANITLAVGALTDLSRSKTDLLVENSMLRQQLIVLKRSVKRPKFTNGDRTRLTLLARFTNFWQSALHIIQPDTILRWLWGIIHTSVLISAKIWPISPKQLSCGININHKMEKSTSCLLLSSMPANHSSIVSKRSSKKSRNQRRYPHRRRYV